MKNWVLTALLVLFVFASGAFADPTYVAASWDNDSYNILDENMALLSTFAIAGSSPNGITGDNGIIYSGHFIGQQVIAHDHLGNELFRWSDAGRLGGLQGLTIIGAQIAAAASGEIHFYDPSTGVYSHSIGGAYPGTVEGLAYDGSSIWALDSNAILKIDPNTGAVIDSIANAAAGEAFGGTGIAVGPAGQLVLAGDSGNFWFVSMADGSVISSGNNGVNMFGLGNIDAAPEPASLALLGLGALAVVRRRRKLA